MKAFWEKFFGFCFWIFGWKVTGKRPDTNKYLIIVAPHTSNWDFFVGVAARNIAGLNSSYLIKKSLMDIPIVGSILRVMGGHPVDRSKKGNLVDQVVEIYNSKEKFVMTITPEGTRSYSPNWKTGFWHIAKNANVPIMMVGFDYSRKLVDLPEPIWTTDDKEADIERIKSHFRNFKGRHPEKGVV